MTGEGDMGKKYNYNKEITHADDPEVNYITKLEALEKENSRLKDELLKCKDDLIEALRKK
ncbi:hypothetical protein ES705_39512 [subsurface metagenome]